MVFIAISRHYEYSYTYHNYKTLSHSIFSKVFPSHFQKYIIKIIIKKKNAFFFLIVHTKAKYSFGEAYLWLSSNPSIPQIYTT